MKKTLIALIAIAALGLCSSAYAHTSFGIGLGFSPAPVYYSAPAAYYAPTPVYYTPGYSYYSALPYGIAFYGSYGHYGRYYHRY